MEAKNLYQKRVEYGQDIFDMCLQEYGNPEAIFLLLEDNPDVDLQTQLQAGQTLVFRVVLPVEVPRKSVEMERYRNDKTRVNCGETEILEDNDSVPLGILTAENVYILTVGGSVVLVSIPDAISAIPDHVLVVSSGAQLLLANANMLIVESHPVLTSSGSTILSNLGIAVFASIKPDNTIFTNTGAALLAANGKYLIIN